MPTICQMDLGVGCGFVSVSIPVRTPRLAFTRLLEFVHEDCRTNNVMSRNYDPVVQTVDYRVRSPRLQSKLCISSRRTRADDRDDSDLSESDVDDARDASRTDASLAAVHSGESPSLPSSKSVSSYRAHFLVSDTSLYLFKCLYSVQTSAFRFSKTSWPDARQILYQLVDIDVPEVVEMLSAPICRTVCDQTYGWMPEDYQKTIREIMTRYLEAWVLENSALLTKLKKKTRQIINLCQFYCTNGLFEQICLFYSC